jgi:hypothetical protein
MKNDLESIFSNVNDWLKFAEAKSATLIAANGLVIFGILRLIQKVDLNLWSKGILIIIFLCFATSLLFCLSSFVPLLRLPFELKNNTKSKDHNLLFFADIENYTPREYLKKLEVATNKNISTPTDNYSGIESMYAKQIITNSVIARYKFEVFKRASWLTLFGGVISMVLVAIYIAGV